jgi:FkbM family methyltransferase
MNKKIFTKFIYFFFSFFPNFFLKFFIKIVDFLKINLVKAYSNKEFLSKILLANKYFYLYLKPNSAQAHDVYKILHNNSKLVYELPLVVILLNVINKLKVKNFLDVGSFMGYYPCLVSTFFNKKKINIISIESNFEYCKYIKKSLIKNSIGNVKVFNEILSNKIQPMKVLGETVLVSDKRKNKNFYSITLDAFCYNNNINPEVLKVDVHGSEGKVIDGFKDHLSNSKVKALLLELHSENNLEKFSGKTRKSIINLLISSNFNCFLIPFENELKHYSIKKEYRIENVNIKYKKIDFKNIDDIFFDNSTKDTLIFCLNKKFKINYLDCFKR